MITRLKNILNEYPKTFWLIILGMFIDQLGGFLIFPFFGLYVTSKYQVGMTEVGLLFTIFAVTGLIGSFLGGALTDKFGRKVIIIFGLVISAISSLMLAFAPNMQVIYLAGMVIGLLGHISGPAHQAMIADVLPEKKRADGFGILRVVGNLAAVIGPAIGGLLAARSYTLLFIIDIITSGITALIIFLYVPETKPQAASPVRGSAPEEESIGQVMKGYFVVIKDQVFMIFIVASLLMVLAYMQMNTTLSVFLRDVHGVPDRGYGLLLSLNAAMVVLFQFWITRQTKRFAPLKVMAWGTVIYGVGFAMFGFVATTFFFILAMVIITIGEMLTAPTGQAIAAALSPEDMRGRYMAVFGFSWSIPTAIGPLGAGLIMDNYNPNWVWFACGISMLLSAVIYTWLHSRSSGRFAHVNGDLPEAKALSEAG